MGSEHISEIITAATFILTSIGAWFARRAKNEAAQANDAVNHRHATGTPRLYDLALKNDERIDELIEWKNDYHKVGLLDTGEKVEKFVKEFRELQGYCSECPSRPQPKPKPKPKKKTKKKSRKK